ncbi:MAG: Na(+)-translocating NADH-quinone reductase subunit C [Cellvibrionales bacterium]|nr:Na(+)-translocating NADH-quinone reductase subunit C [Cellvibrionales bacterium]
MLNKESIRTITVAFVICLVCSVIVSFVAVALKPEQIANKLLDRNKNILQAAGLYQDGMSANEVNDVFAKFEAKIVDLKKGTFLTDEELAAANINVDAFDQYAAAKDPSISESLKGNDPAGIGRLPNYAKVYLKKDNGKIELMVLPINGYGLWSMLYGFVVLKSDLNTIAGLGFYAHAETPGLGGEVDNPKWKALWPGKFAYKDGKEISVAKGKATQPNQVDGLSGATLTTKGVDNLVQFWLGDRGFKPLLTKLKGGA